MTQTRRDFLKAGSGILICTCTGVGASACETITGKSNVPSVPTEAFRVSGNKLVIEIARVPVLTVVGGSAKWISSQAGDKKVYIVRTGETQFDAFINHCTHLGRELD